MAARARQLTGTFEGIKLLGIQRLYGVNMGVFVCLSTALMTACGGGTASQAGSDVASVTSTPGTPVAAPSTSATPTSNPTSSVWTECAGENGTCSFSGTRSVKYGIDAATVVRTFTDSAMCDNSTFGDPAVGQWKACWYADTAPTVAAVATTTPTTTTSPATPAPVSVTTQGSVSAAVPMAQLGGNVQLLGTYP